MVGACGWAGRWGTRLLSALLVLGCSLACSDAGSGDDESDTLFGSTVWQAPGETPADALQRVDGTYGPIDVARLYSEGLPPSWADLETEVGDRPLVVSFKAPPATVLSGAVDDELETWFAEAPVDRDTWWVYYHEPEDDVEAGAFSAADFRAAWTHVAKLAEQADNPRLHATVVLMCWTVAPESGRDWHDYAPPADLVEVLAWDCYAHGDTADSYVPPDQLLGPAVAAADELGVAWGIGETGARVAPGEDSAGRAEWLTDLGAYAREHDARFVTYFDSPGNGNFQLEDTTSIDAWAELVSG